MDGYFGRGGLCDAGPLDLPAIGSCSRLHFLSDVVKTEAGKIHTSLETLLISGNAAFSAVTDPSRLRLRWLDEELTEGRISTAHASISSNLAWCLWK